jgi:putative nucleotidyltransferase with HDIG domain
MTGGDLEFFKSWFPEFCRTFHLEDRKEQLNITLKEEHTLHVCENILSVARGESLGGDDMLIAETIALFHDIGRFPQYAKYRTFKDSASVNHGLLGANTLLEQKVLDRLPARDREIIIDAVKFHNAFAIADIDDADKILFLKLIRDADKLDIWRVFIGFYDSTEEERPEAVGLGLEDVPAYSEEIISHLRNREIISLSRLKTLNDFKLLQLSWIYDLNFTASFMMLSERGYIDRIAATLPQTDEIHDTVALLNAFAGEKSANA